MSQTKPESTRGDVSRPSSAAFPASGQEKSSWFCSHPELFPGPDRGTLCFSDSPEAVWMKPGLPCDYTWKAGPCVSPSSGCVGTELLWIHFFIFLSQQSLRCPSIAGASLGHESGFLGHPWPDRRPSGKAIILGYAETQGANKGFCLIGHRAGPQHGGRAGRLSLPTP